MEINTRGRFVFAVSDSPGKRTAERSDVEAVAIFSSSSSSFFFLSFFLSFFFNVNNYSRLQKSLVYIQKQE